METIKKDNSGTLSLPENLEKLLTDCTLCPRNCHVNRMAGQIGYCLQTGTLRAARAALHYWEDACISGTAGACFARTTILRQEKPDGKFRWNA